MNHHQRRIRIECLYSKLRNESEEHELKRLEKEDEE